MNTEIWASSQWRDEATAWIDGQLALAGMERTGEVEQPRVRPWATVLTACTDHGRVWLKAPGAGNAFEVGLYGLLHDVVPDRVLTPIASDVERAWILLPDGGPAISDELTGDDFVDAVTTTLPQYAQLQRDLAPHVDRLLAAGVADMRPAVMPRRLDEALDTVGAFVDRRDDPGERETFERVVARRDVFTEWCHQLLTAPVAPSIDHNDLHSNNILATAESTRFYDWGDAVVAHPFATMLVTLAWVRTRLGVAADHRQLQGVRDAYLEVFSDLERHAVLVETLEVACRVAKVARALVWERAVKSISLGESGEYADFVTGPYQSLVDLLDDSYLGTT